MSNPVDPNHASQFQENYQAMAQGAIDMSGAVLDGAEEILKTFLDKVMSLAEEKGLIKDQDPVSVRVGGRTVAKSGQEPNINDRQAKILQQAMVDPKQTQGSVQVFVGDQKQPVSHLTHGEIRKDDLGILNQSQQVSNSSVAAQQAPQQPSLQELVQALQKQVEAQQVDISALKEQLTKVPENPLKTANKSVSNWMNGHRTRLAQSVTNVLDQVSVKVDQASSTIKEKHGLLKDQAQGLVDDARGKVQAVNQRASDDIQRVSDTVQGVKGRASEDIQKVSDTVQGVRSGVDRQVGDMATGFMNTVIEPGIRKMLENIGSEQVTSGGEKIRTFKSKDYSYVLREGKASMIPLDGRKALTPENMNQKDLQTAIAVANKAHQEFGQQVKAKTQSVDRPKEKHEPPKMKM